MDRIELSYTIIPIFSPLIARINKTRSYPPIGVSLDCSLMQLFDYIKEKTNGASLLPIGLLENKQIIDFTKTDTLWVFFSEIRSRMIYLFRKNGETPCIDNHRQIHLRASFSHRLSDYLPGQTRIHTTNEENDLPQLNDALKTLCHPEHFKSTLFVHLYSVTANNISQIIALPNDDDHITLETVRDAVKNVLKQESTDYLIYLRNGYEISENEALERNKYSFISVIDRPITRERSVSMINLHAYEMSIRISIYSVLFTKINLINLERFLNYCDQNKSFRFEIHELEISLLTLVELLNNEIGNKWTHINYYDLLIPQSKDINLTYFDWILLFGDTLLEYIRTTQLPLLISQNDNENNIQEKLEEFMPNFLECLDKTLSISLVINPKQTEIQTATILCQNTFIYLLKIVFSSILFLIAIIMQCWMEFPGKKRMNKKLLSDLMFYFCSIILILPIFNVVIYYSRHIPSSQVNQMEIYWPLLLIISILIILHVYQTSEFHRNTFLNKNILQNTYDQAHLNILEIKSTPNNTKTSKYLIENQHKIQFYKILERKSNEFHPTLLHQSITESLTNSSKNHLNHFRSSVFHYIVFSLLILTFIPLITIHPLIPTIYRITKSNMSLTRVSSHINLIHYSYAALSFIFYSLLVVLMIKSISDYLGILYDLRLLLSSTDLEKQIDFESKFYLNLRREENLEYFLHLFQRIIGNIDENHILITTMTCSLLIDIVLILTAIIRVFVYGRSTDLLTVWCLIDIIILSFFIMLFIIIVVLINKLINYDFIRHLRNLKKDIITSNIVHKREQINCDYLDIIIEHIEGVTDQYSVKLLGFVVDHSLAIKIFLSILTGIASAIISLVQK